MTKKVYIFNCRGFFNIHHAPELYSIIQRITGIECKTYSFVFKDKDGKSRSRSGNVNNMETNLHRFLSDCCQEIEFSALELSDKPSRAHYLDTVKRQFGFAVQQWRDSMFSIYIVLPYLLSEDLFLNIWNKISEQYKTNYMVHYDFDSTKDVELCMYGTPMIRGLESPENYYSMAEYKIVYKLHDLRMNWTHELGDVFPICITTGDFHVNETAYQYTKKIDSDATLHTM